MLCLISLSLWWPLLVVVVAFMYYMGVCLLIFVYIDNGCGTSLFCYNLSVIFFFKLALVLVLNP